MSDSSLRPSSLSSELRVFISSTFIDLQEEREYLVRKVFPEIRARCRERGITFTEVDLRWGLTEEDTTFGHTGRICLEEIDRCRPYFIGITGSRYGYVPQIHEIHKDAELLAGYPWIDDAVVEEASIIDLEFRHAALDRGADGRCCAADSGERVSFYFREQPEQDDGGQWSEDKQRLEGLKDRVRQSGLLAEQFSEPEALGRMIYDRLIRIINEDFADAAAPTPLQEERSRHESFAVSRRRAYIPNLKYFKRLNEFVDLRLEDRASADSSSIENRQSAIANSPALVVYAESGSGKSALLAYWIELYRRRHPEAFVIEHYVGIGAGLNRSSGDHAARDDGDQGTAVAGAGVAGRSV